MARDLRTYLQRALEGEGRPSSDYDLNPELVLPEGRKLRDAAVLIPIVEREGSAGLVLTKRASHLQHHPGQVAFPGGKVDQGDADCVAAALREAEEEIGLRADAVEVLGSLPSHETVTGFQVTPVLSIIQPGFEPVPEEGEVAEVFEVPLAHVMNRSNYSIQYRRWLGERRYFFTVPFGPYYIWGATARMLRSLADRMADDAA